MSAQLTTEEVRAMFAARQFTDIEAARLEGRIVGFGNPPIPAGQTITQTTVEALYAHKRYDEIEALRAAGRLDHILNPNTTEGN